MSKNKGARMEPMNPDSKEPHETTYHADGSEPTDTAAGDSSEATAAQSEAPAKAESPSKAIDPRNMKKAPSKSKDNKAIEYPKSGQFLVFTNNGNYCVSAECHDEAATIVRKIVGVETKIECIHAWPSNIPEGQAVKLDTLPVKDEIFANPK